MGLITAIFNQIKRHSRWLGPFLICYGVVTLLIIFPCLTVYGRKFAHDELARDANQWRALVLLHGGALSLLLGCKLAIENALTQTESKHTSEVRESQQSRGFWGQLFGGE